MQQTKQYSYVGWLICILGALFYCYEYFLRIMPSVMTTDLMHAFNINATLLGNLAAFYYYAYTPMQIPVGVMMDRFGPKRLIVFAVQVCGLGILLFGTPGHLGISYLGRFLVGFGSAFAFVGVLKLASMWLPRKYFGFVAGSTTALGMLGGMFGSIYLEKLVRLSGWESTIKISAGAALIIAIAIGLAMPLKSPRTTVLEAEEEKVTYKQLGINLWYLVRHPVIWLNGIVGCLLYFSLSVFAELWGPKYLEVSRHLSSQDAVLASSLVFLAWAIGGPIIGALARNYQRSLKLLMIGSLTTAVFSAILLLGHNLSYSATKVVLFVFAFGSASQVLVFNIACGIVDHKFAGTAVAFTNMLVMLGGSIFEPLVGKFLDLLWHGQYTAGIKSYSPQAFSISLMVIPIGAILSFFILLFMRRYQPRES